MICRRAFTRSACYATLNPHCIHLAVDEEGHSKACDFQLKQPRFYCAFDTGCLKLLVIVNRRWHRVYSTPISHPSSLQHKCALASGVDRLTEQWMWQ